MCGIVGVIGSRLAAPLSLKACIGWNIAATTVPALLNW